MEDQPVLIEEELPEPAASSGAEGEKRRQTTRHEDPKKRTTITITGPGMHVAREVSDEQVLSILRLLLGGEQGGYAPEEHRSTLESPMGLPRRQAISEFYRRVAPKRYPEKLVTIAAHLQQTLGRDTFTPEDLRVQFRQVNETPRPICLVTSKLRWAQGGLPKITQCLAGSRSRRRGLMQ